MTTFVALLLTVLAFAFVTYPLLRRRLPSVGAIEDEQLGELHSRRGTTYSMLKELEFDYESGILSEEDYRELEARYKGKAISILRGIDEVGKGSGVEEEIEKQVQKLRRGKGSKAVDEALEDEVRELRRRRGSKAVNEALEGEVRELRRGSSKAVDEALEDYEVRELRRSKGKGRFCPQCGAGCPAGDRFCSHCGTRLREGGQVD